MERQELNTREVNTQELKAQEVKAQEVNTQELKAQEVNTQELKAQEVKAGDLPVLAEINRKLEDPGIAHIDAAVKNMEDFTSPETLYRELIASVRKYHPSDDISMIEKAYQVAYHAHEGQVRKSGSPILSIRCAWGSS